MGGYGDGVECKREGAGAAAADAAAQVSNGIVSTAFVVEEHEGNTIGQQQLLRALRNNKSVRDLWFSCRGFRVLWF